MALGNRTYLELQDLVLAHGFSATKYRTLTKSWLNEALAELFRTYRMPDFSDKGFQTLSVALVAGTTTYEINGSNLQQITQARIVKANANDLALRRISLERYRLLDDAQSAEPTYFSTTGDELLVWPKPVAAGTLELDLDGAFPTAFMVADGDTPGIPDEHRGALVDYALSQAYALEHDPEMATWHENRWLKKRGAIAAVLRDPTPEQINGMLDLWGSDSYGAGLDPLLNRP